MRLEETGLRGEKGAAGDFPRGIEIEIDIGIDFGGEKRGSGGSERGIPHSGGASGRR